MIFAQTLNIFDGKWCFTGLRTTIFKAEGDKLYLAMIEYADTANFNRFVQTLPVDSSLFTEASVSAAKDTIIINASFPAIAHQLRLLYSVKDSTHIWFTGDVYFDSTRVIATNNNCNLNGPACINRLYSRNDLKTISALKTNESFTRDDAFEFLLRLNEELKSKCNRCYAGFTDAYMNGILVDMGFNPIVKRTANKSVWYNTSGFTMFLKEKFSGDQRILNMIDKIFDWYLK
jgi:hypothetical protein